MSASRAEKFVNQIKNQLHTNAPNEVKLKLSLQVSIYFLFKENPIKKRYTFLPWHQ